MSRPRIKYTGKELSSYYFVTNRIAGGYRHLHDLEKDKIIELLKLMEKKFAFYVHEYVIMENHWHLIVEIPSHEEMTESELREKYAQSYRPALDPTSELLELFKEKAHDLSYIIANFEQRFAQWFNKRNGRQGHLYGAPFDSVLLEGNLHMLKPILYTILNPVRAGIVVDPKDYFHCSYGQRLAGVSLAGDQRYFDLILKGMDDDNPLLGEKLSKKKEAILNWFRLLLVEERQFKKNDSCQLNKALFKAGKNIELTWLDQCRHKARFFTKAMAIGSKKFINTILDENADRLHYARPRRAYELDQFQGLHSLNMVRE
mgnify:CR=1 FL=1